MAEDGIINAEIKKYICEFAKDKLENCQAFVKVYGKGFAEKQLEANVKNVYTNAVGDGMNGFYDYANREITICKGGQDGALLTIEDIEWNARLVETILHEAIHAIFNKSEEECKRLGIKRSTGILEEIDEDNEIGRGLNEGLTVWLCEKAGINSAAYKFLKDIMYQLEIARGTHNIMKMAKGDIEHNVTRCLGLSMTECEHLLALGDQQYSIGKKLLSAEPEEMKMLEMQRRNTALEMDSIIFIKYFKKEFDQIRKRGRITKKELEKFRALSRHMQTMQGTPGERLYASIQFQEDLDILRKRYSENFYKKAETLFYKGKLTGKNLEKYAGLIGAAGRGQMNIFFNRIAAKMSFSCQEDIFDLLTVLNKEGRLSEADRYTVKKAKAGEREVAIFCKDGYIESTVNGRKAKNVKLLEDDLDGYFDFTLEMDEDYEAIVSNFLKLKERIYEENERSRIQILERTVVINDEEIYIIGDGGITRAESVQEVDLDPKQRTVGRNLPAEVRNNIIDRVKSAVFYKGKREQEPPNYRENQGQEFRRSIRDMSKYTPANKSKKVVKTPTKDTKTNESTIDDTSIR